MWAPGTATKEIVTEVWVYVMCKYIQLLLELQNIVFLTLCSFSHKQMDLESEKRKIQQQVLSEKHHYEQKASELESQIAALQTAWEFDRTAAQHKIVSTETVEWGTQVFTEQF